MGQTVTEPIGADTLTINAVPEQASKARAFARATLRRYGCSPNSIDNGELIVSELTTNAINAAPGQKIEISLFPVGELIAIYVYDPTDDLPKQKTVGPGDETGRGIPIVKYCSRRSGVFKSVSGGKVVWAMMERYS
ncbi:hypothetical protein GCM10023196_053560 [Actinoallomurus vinaceus]|uniref:Histidine kinase/HSP90-like ATPase domain-containing protein n=1 Tax=Actinoallomurus vinaceus TaxID=1080074 RepID=A0ABP8UEB4_9ACTN